MSAIVLCSPIMREYLINYARSLIYTTALGLPTLAMIRSVYRLMDSGGTQQVSLDIPPQSYNSLTLSQSQQRLWHLMGYFRSRLLELPTTSHLQIPRTAPTSPIFSLCTPRPRELAAYCQGKGLIVRPIVPPTVPEGGQRVRVCLHAGNTEQDLDRLVSTYGQWLQSVRNEEEQHDSLPRSHL